MLCSEIQKSAIIAALLIALAIVARAETISGKVVAITDGDTITILDANKQQHKIRLAGIDAPERGQAFGQAAKRKLSELVFNRQVTVEFTKRDRWKRIVGLVSLDGRDINEAMIRAGFAWFFKRYERELDAGRRQSYARAEAVAREGKRGLWNDPGAVAPWDYRRRS